MSQDIIIRRNIGVDNDAQLEITNIDNNSIISQFTVKSVIDNTIFKLVGEHTDINNTVNGLYSISSDGRFVFGSTNVPSNPSTLVEFVAEGYAILFPRVNVTDISTPTNGHIIYDLLSNKFKFRENDVWNSIPISLIGSTSSNGSETWLGEGAGNNSTNFTHSLFLGYYAGSDITGNSQKSNFIGYYAGANATNAYNANFIGVNAGDGATDANKSNFIGHRTGNNATNAHTSNFFGHYAGNNATNASRSIFIGDYAGYNDSVDNYNNDNTYTSILIGSYTSTGGFSKSIALGYLAANTKENQFVVGDSYVNWKIAGIEYIMPSSLGDTGDMLTISDSATGALSWTDPNTRYLQLSGGTMTGAIQFGTGGQNINRGTFDNSTGGDQGISLTCAIGYELNWQGGRLSSWYNGAYTNLQLDSSLQFNTDNSIIKAVENNVYGATSGPFTIHASDGTAGGNGGGILLLRGGNSFTGDNELAGDVQIKGGINAYPSTLYGGYIRLFTNDLERLTIDSANGFVGINTTRPTQHLEVNGNILSNSKIIKGTGGNGFLQLLSQNAAPSAVLSNIKIYSNSTNNLSWVRRNTADNADITRTIVAPDSNFTLTFTGAYNTTFAQTGNYTYTLPNTTTFITGSAAAFTDGRIPITTINGLLTDSSLLTYAISSNVTTITSTGNANIAGATRLVLDQGNNGGILTLIGDAGLNLPTTNYIRGGNNGIHIAGNAGSGTIFLTGTVQIGNTKSINTSNGRSGILFNENTGNGQARLAFGHSANAATNGVEATTNWGGTAIPNAASTGMNLIRISSAINASANGQQLTALYVQPSFGVGAFTGVSTAVIRFFTSGGNSLFTALENGDITLGYSSGKTGFFGATPVVKQTITGSRSSGAALADLLTKLSTLGLIIDSTTV